MSWVISEDGPLTMLKVSWEKIFSPETMNLKKLPKNELKLILWSLAYGQSLSLCLPEVCFHLNRGHWLEDKWDTVIRDGDIWKDHVEVYSTELSGLDEFIFALGSVISTFSSRWSPTSTLDPWLLAFLPLTEVINVCGTAVIFPKEDGKPSHHLTDSLSEAIVV